MPSEFHGLVKGISNEAYHGDHGKLFQVQFSRL